MKRNAIIRIVIWSIVILLLCAILFVGMNFNPFYSRRSSISGKLSPAETSETSHPSETSVSQTTAPALGKTSEALASEPIPVTEPVAASLPEGSVSIPADQVRELDIEWLAGFIWIQSADVETIQFSESGVTDTKYAMCWKQKDNKLTIQFSEGNNHGFGILTNLNLRKDLTVYVPRDWTCSSLEIDAASAQLRVYDMTIREVEVDTASGNCMFTNCSIDELDLDTASGDVQFSGTLNVLECDAASASVYAVLDNVPNRIEMDSMSGDLDLTLPPDAGFTVTLDAMHSDFTSDFTFTTQNGNYICGNGSCRIKMSAMSGDLIIRMGGDAASTGATSTIPTPTPFETRATSDDNT